MIELIKEILFGISDPNVNQAFLPIPALMGAAALGKMAMGFDWGGKRKKAAAAAKAKYEAQKKVYKNQDITNPFADLKNQFTNMENTMEDVTVNQTEADFQKQMFQQSQANILQNLRGAAGSSGIAGLAQAMANQSQTQAQRAAASIGQQEARNNAATAKEAARLNQQEALGQANIDKQSATGEVARQSAEMSKQATLLGMDAQGVQGANQAVMQGKQMMADGVGDLVGSLSGGMDKDGVFSIKKYIGK